MKSVKLWSTADVAEYLGISKRAAEYQIARPDFPRAICIGERTRRWKPSEVEDYYDAKREATPAALRAA